MLQVVHSTFIAQLSRKNLFNGFNQKYIYCSHNVHMYMYLKNVEHLMVFRQILEL